MPRSRWSTGTTTLLFGTGAGVTFFGTAGAPEQASSCSFALPSKGRLIIQATSWRGRSASRGCDVLRSEPEDDRSAASRSRSSAASRRPTESPRRSTLIAVVCSTSTRVEVPAMSMLGRKERGGAESRWARQARSTARATRRPGRRRRIERLAARSRMSRAGAAVGRPRTPHALTRSRSRRPRSRPSRPGCAAPLRDRPDPRPPPRPRDATRSCGGAPPQPRAGPGGSRRNR